MILSNKRKGHRSCSCRQCTLGKGRPFGQAVHKRNEKKLRQLTKKELRRAMRELPRDLDDIDVLGKINSPYTD